MAVPSDSPTSMALLNHEEPQRPITLEDSVAWGADRRVPAWLLSLVVHAISLAALIGLVTQLPRGAAEVENRSGGIVLVNLQAEATEYLSEGDVEQVPQPMMTTAASAPATEAPLLPDLPGMEAFETSSEGAAESLLDSLPGAEALATVPQPTGKIGGQVTTEVFGVKGTGSRFVYVFDRSQSMDGFGSLPILAARQELLQSLDSLQRSHQFQIIFYNDAVRVFDADGLPTMYHADDQIKRQARDFVRSMRPAGGTDHLNALMQAFRFAPDVIFLLTDAEGGFTKPELEQISRYNRSAAVINTIEFGERRGRDRSLEQVARQSGGQYLFKNIRTLRIER